MVSFCRNLHKRKFQLMLPQRKNSVQTRSRSGFGVAVHKTAKYAV